MSRTSYVKIASRILIYVLGLFLLAVGIAFSMNSNLGVSPIHSMPYVINIISHIPLGNCVIYMFCFYILLQIILLRRNFKIINLTQIIFSTIFGYFVEFTKWLIGDFSIPTYFGKLLMMGISIIFIATGVMLYVEMQLVPMPMEGLTLALAELTGISFPNVKVAVDCIVVTISLLLSLFVLHGITGIREGTVITAMVTGKVIAAIRKPLVPPLQRICF